MALKISLFSLVLIFNVAQKILAADQSEQPAHFTENWEVLSPWELPSGGDKPDSGVKWHVGSGFGDEESSFKRHWDPWGIPR